jgi:ATP-binding cassette subfamily B multidrug efflux pump
MREKIRWYWKHYKNYKYVLAVLLFLTPVQVALQVLLPRLIEFGVDYVKTGSVDNHPVAGWLVAHGAGLGMSAALSLSLSVVLLGLVAVILYIVVQAHRTWMNVRFEWVFRQKAFEDVTLKGPDFFNRFRTGDLVTRMTDDVAEKLSWFACSGIFRCYEATLMVIFAVTMMTSINPKLALYSAGPLPILILIFFRTSSLLDKRYDHLQKRISHFTDVMEACLSGIRVVKAYVREKAQMGKVATAMGERKQAEIDTIRANTVVESMYFYIWQIGIIIVTLAGGLMAIDGSLSVGELVAFVYYIVYLVFPMFDIGQFLVKSRQSAVSIDRLAELEKVPPMVPDSGTLATDANLKARLAFDNVRFAFPGSERTIIDGISFTVEPGQTVALVGKVGSGKTWLVNMIPRLVDPTGGSITLDDRDLRMYRLDDLRSSIGYVPQEPILFSDTVRNNIVFGREAISDAVLEWAIDVAQLKDEIAAFPQGLDTPIGTRGMAISGGQKQRVALARALVGKPRVLILDDCTSALDARTEARLWARLHEVMPDMTAILVTHRPDTLEKADMIYVLDQGHIIESGRHFDLMSRNGHYARVYRQYQLAEQVGNGGNGGEDKPA